MIAAHLRLVLFPALLFGSPWLGPRYVRPTHRHTGLGLEIEGVRRRHGRSSEVPTHAPPSHVRFHSELLFLRGALKHKEWQTSRPSGKRSKGTYSGPAPTRPLYSNMLRRFLHRFRQQKFLGPTGRPGWSRRPTACGSKRSKGPWEERQKAFEAFRDERLQLVEEFHEWHEAEGREREKKFGFSL
jgi:hypothetical protein